MYPESLLKYIPPKFDLAKYDATAKLDLLDWLRNIGIKSMHFDEASGEYRGKDLEERILNSIKQGVIVEGFLSHPTRDDVEFIANSEWNEVISVVRDLRAFEINAKSKDLETVDETKDTFAVNYDDKEQANLAWVRIDLSCSDKEIVGAFSNWLTRTRDRMSNEKIEVKRRGYKLKKFSPATLRNWHEARLLAYLDLMSWNILKGQNITSKVIGDILFPDPNDLRDSTAIINDTVKPLSKELTSKETLDRIFKVVVDENRKKTA